MKEENNNNRQLVLPLISDCEVEYKEIVKQNWKFTFSRQYLTSVNTKRVIGLIIAQMKEEGEMRDFYQVRAADIIRKTDVAKEEVYRTMRETIFELVNVAFFFEDAKNHEIIPRHLLDTTRFENPASYKNGVLTVAFTPLPEVSTLVTSLEVITSIPCFLKFFSSSFEISSSSTGTILGRNSIRVTFVPMVL